MQYNKYEKIAIKYCKLVKKKCPKAFKKRIIPELEGAVCDFCNENETTAIDVIYDRFGRPEDFAAAYVDNMDDTEKLNLLKRSKRIKIAVIVAVAIFSIALIVGAVIFIWQDSQSIASYYGEDIIRDTWLD